MRFPHAKTVINAVYLVLGVKSSQPVMLAWQPKSGGDNGPLVMIHATPDGAYSNCAGLVGVARGAMRPCSVGWIEGRDARKLPSSSP
jgi:hypothetical protein